MNLFCAFAYYLPALYFSSCELCISIPTKSSMLAGPERVMDQRGIVKVLLIGDNAQVFSLSLPRLEEDSCECYFAKSQEEVACLLEHTQFDIVLSTRTLRGTGTGGLGGLLWGGRSSLFYALRVEIDCWWLPVLQRGQECFGRPALRTSEFMSALDDVIREIKTDGRVRWSTAPENQLTQERSNPC
jgi:hypothetical protein